MIAAGAGRLPIEMGFPSKTMEIDARKPVSLFSTAPQSAQFDDTVYSTRLTEVARWSEETGCKGILIYSDNSLIDPWLAAQIVMNNTKRLSPLVAVQPVYMHPYSAAKMVASLAYLYGRRVCLNMIAGGFRNDLHALCDETEHDDRYERLKEYTLVIKGLLSSTRPFSFSGKFYTLRDLVMRPSLPPDLIPEIFMSGSSEAGLRIAKHLGATTVEYPKPQEDYSGSGPHHNCGIRIGIIAAEQAEQAWDLAHSRFPGDRTGQIRHLLAMKVSDSHWHKQLSEMERHADENSGVYWLWPFKNYNTFCPYLVGDYTQVSDEIVKYMRVGFDNFILDIPANESDLRRTAIVFSKAAEKLSLDSKRSIAAYNAVI